MESISLDILNSGLDGVNISRYPTVDWMESISLDILNSGLDELLSVKSLQKSMKDPIPVRYGRSLGKEVFT